MSVFVNQGYLNITLDTGIDITSATATLILYKKPDGITGYFEADVVDTTKLFYEFKNEDLDLKGMWKFQAFARIDGRNTWGSVVQKQVFTPLVTPDI
jgi:hypothetical protein